MVDDDPSSQALLRRELTPIAEVTVEESLQAAIDRAADGFDCVVLDLGLPDGWGLDSLLTFRREVAEVPVVVVSGSVTSDFEENALRAGASRYLAKTELALGDLSTAVSEAIAEKSQGRARASVLEELANLAHLGTGSSATATTAALMGEQPLSEALPERFADLVATYTDLLDVALDSVMFRGPTRASQHLRDLGDVLGALGASPRDVVELHSEALELQRERRVLGDSGVFMAEARIVVLELMGHLANYYRRQTLGLAGRDHRQ